MANIIFFSHKKVDMRGFRSGPAQRVLELCLALSKKGHTVHIAEKAHVQDSEIEDIKVINWTNDLLTDIEKKYDVAIIHIWDNDPDFLDALSDIPVAVDIYAPIMIEEANYLYNIEYNKESANPRSYFDSTVVTNTRVFEIGDYFFCANKRQYFFYLGILNVLGRINPKTYDQHMLGIVETCPQIKDETPTKQILAPTYNLEGKKIFVWMSGIFPWYDPFTPIRAIAEIAKERDDIVLAFVGYNNPQTNQDLLPTYEKALALAKELGVYNKNVFFHDFVPQDDRINVYSEATGAIVSFTKDFEALLCSRTRTIDCLWGRLPTISTDVDDLGDKIKKHDLGRSVPPQDVSSMKEAILSLALDEKRNKEIRQNIESYIQQNFNWNTQIKDLDDFCNNAKIDKNKKLLSVYSMIQDKKRLMFNVRNDLQVKLAEITRRDTTIEKMGKTIEDQNTIIEEKNLIIEKNNRAFDEMKAERDYLTQRIQELEDENHKVRVHEGQTVEEIRDFYNQKIHALNKEIVQLKKLLDRK